MASACNARWMAFLFLTAWLGGAACTFDEPFELPSESLVDSGLGIVGGMPTSDWPAIGAYLIDGGYGLCTATLVADDVLLTAAHCAEGSTNDDLFYVGANINNATWQDVYSISDAIIHPSYNPNSSHPRDVAVLLLNQPLNSVEPIPVNTTAFTNSWRGDWLHYVGFGSNTTYSGSGAGQKRETDIQINDYDSYVYIHYTEGTNTCSGDSGGPGLVDLDGQWYVAGINSSVGNYQGYDPCGGWGYQMRVDAELDFLDDYFDPYTEPPPDDDDDDDVVGDDDDDVVGDDDDTDPPDEIGALPEPFVHDDYGEGCAHVGSRANQPTGLLWVLAAGTWVWLRRRC